ncbi:MAG: hypothetical protein R3D70_24420 [Rhizobiaceae bacterium]
MPHAIRRTKQLATLAGLLALTLGAATPAPAQSLWQFEAGTDGASVTMERQHAQFGVICETKKGYLASTVWIGRRHPDYARVADDVSRVLKLRGPDLPKEDVATISVYVDGATKGFFTPGDTNTVRLLRGAEDPKGMLFAVSVNKGRYGYREFSDMIRAIARARTKASVVLLTLNGQTLIPLPIEGAYKALSQMEYDACGELFF